MNNFAKAVLLATLMSACSVSMAGAEISGKVTISGNKASNIKSQGGSGSVGFKGVGVDVNASGSTNVNSLVLAKDSKVTGTVTISGNEAKDITNSGGGELNLNSVVMK